MATIALLGLFGITYVVLQSRINAGDEKPWPWQKSKDETNPMG